MVWTILPALAGQPGPRPPARACGNAAVLGPGAGELCVNWQFSFCTGLCLGAGVRNAVTAVRRTNYRSVGAQQGMSSRVFASRRLAVSLLGRATRQARRGCAGWLASLALAAA